MACRGGSLKYQKCLIFHRPSVTLDHSSAHLETGLVCLRHVIVTSLLVLNCYYLVRKHLPACDGPVSEHHSTTGPRPKLTVLESKPACCKHRQADLVTSCQHGKYPRLWSLSWLDHSRTSREHTRTSCKEKPTWMLQEEATGKCTGQAGFMLLTHSLYLCNLFI